LKDRARELEEQQRGMLNPKVMNMIDACMLDFNSLCLCHNSSKLKLLLDLHSVEKREASLKKMLGDGAERQGKDPADDRGTTIDRYNRGALKTTWENVDG
jgi:hypothetical protein